MPNRSDIKWRRKRKQQQKNYIVIKPHTDCKLCALKWRCKNKQKLILSNTLTRTFLFSFFLCFYWIIDLSALFIELDSKMWVIQAGASWSHTIHCKRFCVFLEDTHKYISTWCNKINANNVPCKSFKTL